MGLRPLLPTHLLCHVYARPRAPPQHANTHSCGAAQPELGGTTQEEHQGIRLGRARLLLALRYLLWRVEAAQHEASWGAGGAPGAPAGGAGAEQAQRGAERCEAPAEAAGPGGSGDSSPPEACAAAGNGSAPSPLDAGAAAGGSGGRVGGAGDGAGSGGGTGAASGGGAMLARVLADLAAQVQDVLYQLALPDRRFMADATMLHTAVRAAP